MTLDSENRQERRGKRRNQWQGLIGSIALRGLSIGCPVKSGRISTPGSGSTGSRIPRSPSKGRAGRRLPRRAATGKRTQIESTVSTGTIWDFHNERIKGSGKVV